MIKKAYLVGIKGNGMTSLAVYLKEKGYEVTGSDVEEKFPTDIILNQNHIQIIKGFSPQHINKDINILVTTGAHGGMTNIEVRKAKSMKIPVYMHGQFIGELMKNHKGISVAGCHGKTTTAALLAFLLRRLGFDP